MEKPLVFVTDWNAEGIVVPGRYIFHTLLERLGSERRREAIREQLDGLKWRPFSETGGGA